MEYETRVSFRGRTLAGYANWSLNGRNRVRLNANVLWGEALECVESYFARNPDDNIGPKCYASMVQVLFGMFLGNTARHEVIHLLLHQERDVRRHAGRYREAKVHERALERIDRFFGED